VAGVPSRRWTQQRQPRCGWNRLWRILLAVWCLGWAFEVWRLWSITAQFTRRASGLAYVAVKSVCANALTEAVLIWGFGAALLAVAAYVTRPRTDMVEVAELPPPPPVMRAPPKKTIVGEAAGILYAVAAGIGVLVAAALGMLVISWLYVTFIGGR
jgi:hypothetical protein